MLCHFKKILVLLIAFFITACATPKPTNDSRWFLTEQGNKFDVISSGNEEEYTLSIVLLQQSWSGSLKGGEEKVADRKSLMTKLADNEAKRVCGTGYTSEISDFVMVDQDPEKYNTGGLLGVIVSQAIVAAISEYENLPTRYNMQFNCKNGGGAVKATQITTTNNSAFDAKTPTPLVQENKTDNDKNITPVVEATK